MKTVIIIRGPLGIGKTTISKQIAKELNADYISVDKVIEDNGLDKKDSNFTPEDFLKANQIILEYIKNKDNFSYFIIDGCFYFIEQIENLKKSLDNLFVFNLKATLNECIKRDSQRKKSYGEKSTQEVFNLVSKFDYGVNIDANNKTESQVVKKILSFIN